MEDSGIVVASATPLTAIVASTSVTVGKTRPIRIVTTGYVWGKLGLGATTATAGTAGEFLITPNQPFDLTTTQGQDTIALIQETAGSKACVIAIG